MAALPSFDANAVAKPKAKTMNGELEKILSDLDPDALSPKQALDLAYKIKAAAAGK